MVIIQKKISDLRHPNYNPRQIKKNQFEQLKKSLMDFTAVEPAVINTGDPKEFYMKCGYKSFSNQKVGRKNNIELMTK
jgi:hypothetical protein